MKSVLILGGSGFVGSALVPKLLEANIKTSLLNRGTRSIPGTHQFNGDRNNLVAPPGLDSRYDAIIDTSCYTLKQARLAYELLGTRAALWINLSSRWREIN